MILDLLMLAQVSNTGMGTNAIIVRAKDVPGPFQQHAVWLVAGLLVLLALVFLLITKYQHRLEQSSYLSGELSESLSKAWESRLTEPINARWEGGRFHQELMANRDWLSALPDGEKQPVPEDSIARHWQVLTAQRELYLKPDPLSAGSRGGLGGTRPPGLPSPPDQEERINTFLQKIGDWRMNVLHPEAHRRYMGELEEARKETRGRALRAVGDIDQGMARGRGPEFVLQFTALVVIIFATLALAILDRLSSEQAGTILAAIAGYVLGQTVRRSDQLQRTAPAPSGKADQQPTPTKTPGAGNQPKPDQT